MTDQFENRLDSCYDGTNVVVEEFVNTGGTQMQWGNKGPISTPNNTFASGLKVDREAMQETVHIPNVLTQQQRTDWANFTLRVNGFDNSFALLLVNEGKATKKAWADQKIWVHDHLLGETKKRTFEFNRVNVTPVANKPAFKIYDE